MMDNATLLNEIERFIAKHDMSPSGFGRWAINNPNFVTDLAKPGFSPHLKTANKIRIKMKNYKPKKGKRYAD